MTLPIAQQMEFTQRRFLDLVAENEALKAELSMAREQRYHMEPERDEACEGESLRAQERDEARMALDGMVAPEEARQWREAHDRAIAVLRDLEWKGANRVRNSGCCPACGVVYPQTHESDCRLYAAIGGAR